MSLPSSSPSWVLPILRRALSLECTIQRRRGDTIWEIITQKEGKEDNDIQHITNAMQSMNVHVASPTLPSSSSSSSRLNSPSLKSLTDGPKKKKASPSTVNQTFDGLKTELTLPPGQSYETTLRNLFQTIRPKLNIPATNPHSATETTTHSTNDSPIYGYEFANDVPSKERVLAHQLADEYGLDHESLGFYPRRHLYVMKPYQQEENKRQLETHHQIEYQPRLFPILCIQFFLLYFLLLSSLGQFT